MGMDQSLQSGILSGSVDLTAADLLKNPFVVKSASLSAATTLQPASTDRATLRIGIKNRHLDVDGVLAAHGKLITRSANDGTRELTPTLLEVMLGEPQHKSLIALVGSIASALGSVFALILTKKSKTSASPDSGRA
jgi:hypothetical protein